MRKQMSNSGLFLCFTALTGAVIAGLVWLYLKIANVGITVIWEMIPAYIDSWYYTILMCLAGGVVIGLFHRIYGPYPEQMADSVKRVKDTGTYPYRKLPMIVAASFLSLFFGGAVGPESGLVSLLLGLCCWAMDQFGLARWKMNTLLAGNPYIMNKELFRVMAAGLFLPPDQIVYDKGKIEWKRKEQVAAGVTAGLTGLAVYELLNLIFGRCLSVPHLQGGVLLLRDKVAVVLLILIFQKISNWFFGKMREKNLAVLNAVLGGLILGLIGTALPMTMFSGGSDIQTMQYEYLKFTPYLLIVIGVVKLFLTNVCIASGWRGGHFFPMLFSGLSIGYGFAAIFHTNEIVSVVLVTGALLGTVLQQPLGALALSLIFFPMKNLGWMILASMVGGCVPVPVSLRTNPENKGFVYNMIHMKKRGKFLPGKE